MTVTPPSRTPVHAFADRAWEQFLVLEPLWATAQGDDRWDDRLGDPGPAGRAAEAAMLDAWEAEMTDLEDPLESVEDRVTHGLIRVVIGRMRRAHALRIWEMDAIDQYNGPQGLMGDLARLQPMDTPERFERLLARIAAYPAWMDAHHANIEEGVASGRTAAAPVLERCITQTRRMVATPAAESPLVLAGAGLDETRRERLITAIERDVLPAQARWLEMLEALRPGTCARAMESAICPMARPSIVITSRAGRRSPRTLRPSMSSGWLGSPRSEIKPASSRSSWATRTWRRFVSSSNTTPPTMRPRPPTS